jgi:hypothetical protein
MENTFDNLLHPSKVDALVSVCGSSRDMPFGTDLMRHIPPIHTSYMNCLLSFKCTRECTTKTPFDVGWTFSSSAQLPV